MRTHGLVEDVPEAAAADHLCWVYADDAAFDEAAREFLAGGLARGERVLCIAQRAEAVDDALADAEHAFAAGQTAGEELPGGLVECGLVRVYPAQVVGGSCLRDDLDQTVSAHVLTLGRAGSAGQGRDRCHSERRMSSTRSRASPKSIRLLSRKKRGFCTPA